MAAIRAACPTSQPAGTMGTWITAGRQRSRSPRTVACSSATIRRARSSGSRRSIWHPRLLSSQARNTRAPDLVTGVARLLVQSRRALRVRRHAAPVGVEQGEVVASLAPSGVARLADELRPVRLVLRHAEV